MTNVYAERGAFFAPADKQLLQAGLTQIAEIAKDKGDALTVDRCVKLMRALDEYERAGRGIDPEVAKAYHRALLACEQAQDTKRMMKVLTEFFATMARTEPDPAKPCAKFIVEHIGHAIAHIAVTHYGPAMLGPLLAELEKQSATWDEAGWPDAKAAWDYVTGLVRFSIGTCEEGENPWAEESA